jgi:CRP-like cAMP-binding protein
MKAAFENESNLRDFLRTVTVFSELDDSTLASVVSVCHVKKVEKGQFLFFQEDPGEGVYIVRKGCVSIRLSTADGRELVINEMYPGDLFGDIGSILAQARTASAVVHQRGEVLYIQQVDFLRLVDCQPKVMHKLLELLAERLRECTQRESALAFLDAPARVARLLVDAASKPVSLGGLVTIGQEDIAQHIGATRQTVAKILGQWRRAGWIITGRGRIMVVNRTALRKISDQTYSCLKIVENS